MRTSAVFGSCSKVQRYQTLEEINVLNRSHSEGKTEDKICTFSFTYLYDNSLSTSFFSNTLGHVDTKIWILSETNVGQGNKFTKETEAN